MIWFVTQQDPIGIAGGLNLYGFAGGDPVNFSDPFGLCEKPKGKGVGVCIESFIAAKRALLMPVGNNRGPRSDGGGFKTSARFSIDVETGALSGLETAQGKTLGIPGGGEQWIGEASSDGNGGWNVPVVGYGRTKGAPLPFINYALNINISSGGNVSVTAGAHDGYPSYEVWEYGTGDPRLVYHHKEGWIGELAGSGDVKIGN